jgi:Rieske 2Fe-2S family protein
VYVSHGLIFIFVGDGNPPSTDDVWHDVDPFLIPHALDNAKLCHRMSWDIAANWKLVIENFAECYHCGPAHPEYCRVMSHALPGTTGHPKHLEAFAEETRQWEGRCGQLGHFFGNVESSRTTLHCASRMPIGRNAFSQSQGGKPLAPLMGTFRTSDGGVTSVRIHPGAYVIASCDYAIVNRFTPLTVNRTMQEILWLVHPDAKEGVDYNRDEITWLWRVTSDQDQTIIEDNQAGVASRAYRPGRYALPEETSDRFVLWYLDQLTAVQHTDAAS